MQDVINFLKSLPFIGPLLQLVWSRKAVIAVAIVGLIGDYLIKLPPDIEGYVLQVVAGLISIAIIVAAQILGIALEDAAAKRAGNL